MAEKDKSYWQQQANLVRSGELSPETVTAATSHQLNVLGRTGYMNLYPEVFKNFAPTFPESSRIGWDEENKIRDLQGLLSQFTGPESGFTRWLINKKIHNLRYKLASLRGIESARPTEYKPAPVPDWMQQYIQPIETAPVTETRGRQRRPVETKQLGTLSSLGAQEELTSTQQAQMAGYLAWQKAGAPTEYSAGALRDMSDWSRWWEEYTRQSQALFPKQQSLTPRWRVAEQR